MGTWSDTQTAYHGREVNHSERLENCTLPDVPCECCLYALTETLFGYDGFTYCLLMEDYVFDRSNKYKSPDTAS